MLQKASTAQEKKKRERMSYSKDISNNEKRSYNRYVGKNDLVYLFNWIHLNAGKSNRKRLVE